MGVEIMKDVTIIKVTAILCLTIICCTALIKGIDSVLIGTVASIIGGIAGYEIGKTRKEGEK